MQSLDLSADEEFLGSSVGITVTLISLCRKTELPAYLRIAEELETLDDYAGSLGCKMVRRRDRGSERPNLDFEGAALCRRSNGGYSTCARTHNSRSSGQTLIGYAGLGPGNRHTPRPTSFGGLRHGPVQT